MKRKVLSVLLVLCLLAGCLPLTVSAAEVNPSEISEGIARVEAALSEAKASQPEVAAPAQKSARADSSAAAVLVSYIQQNGTLDDDGNRYVEHQLSESGVTSVAGFTYDAQRNCVQFIAVHAFDASYIGAAFDYNLATQQADQGLVTVLLNAEGQEVVAASPSLDISTYTESTILNFEKITGADITDAELQDLCNQTLQLSILFWAIVLEDLNVGVSMYDLGFTSFFETPVTPPAPLPTQFVDVADGQYYVDAVKWAVASDITTGTDETHFSPDGACTRAQAVTFLWRTAGSPTPENTTTAFTDVKPGAYYEKAVQWAVENGVTLGTSATKFSPDETCTRGQIVTFQYRAVNSPEVSAQCPFTDVKSGAYYENAVMWAVASGVTTGTSATKFSPDETCTRGQIVTFLYRAFG